MRAQGLQSVGSELEDLGKSRNLGAIVAIPGDDVRGFARSLIEEYRARSEPKYTREEASMCRTSIEALLKKSDWSDLTARETIKNCLSIDDTTARMEDKESAKELVKSFFYLQGSVGQLCGSKIEEEVIEEG